MTALLLRPSVKPKGGIFSAEPRGREQLKAQAYLTPEAGMT